MSKSTRSPQASPPIYVVYLKIAFALICELLLLVVALVAISAASLLVLSVI